MKSPSSASPSEPTDPDNETGSADSRSSSATRSSVRSDASASSAMDGWRPRRCSIWVVISRRRTVSSLIRVGRRTDERVPAMPREID